MNEVPKIFTKCAKGMGVLNLKNKHIVYTYVGKKAFKQGNVRGWTLLIREQRYVVGLVEKEVLNPVSFANPAEYYKTSGALIAVMKHDLEVSDNYDHDWIRFCKDIIRFLK
jgi:hypothetical protein